MTNENARWPAIEKNELSLRRFRNETETSTRGDTASAANQRKAGFVGSLVASDQARPSSTSEVAERMRELLKQYPGKSFDELRKLAKQLGAPRAPNSKPKEGP